MTQIDPLSLIPAAFLAGVLMFLAPCTLPLVPGYLAFIAGVRAGDERMQSSVRRRLLVNALAFVLGFSIIFILLGVFAGTLGVLLGPWRGLLSRVAGALIILFGITMLGIIRIPFLSSERRVTLPPWLTIGRPESSLLVGVLFALGWSPCIGPILGTVLLFASSSGTQAEGAILLAAFSLGLGVPFMLAAMGMSAVSNFATRAGNFLRVLSVAGALVLIMLGVLMVLGDVGLLTEWGFRFLQGVHYDALLNYM